MLQNGIDAPHLISCAFAVVGGNNGLQYRAPISGMGIVAWVYLIQTLFRPCLFYPQSQARLVGIEA